MSGDVLDVVVIGAGQAGLAIGKALKDEDVSFVILEAEHEVGTQWEKHYDSLVLFTPRRYSTLPGLPLPGNRQGYATKNEFARYLRLYKETFQLPVVRDARVTHLTKDNDVFTIQTKAGTYKAKQVIVAVGCATAQVPEFSFAYIGFNIHSSQYIHPEQIPPGHVLVVGGGNSGAQIAVELSHTHEVDIALHGPIKTIPPTILGKSFYWWNITFGLDRIPTNSFLGMFLQRCKDFVVGNDLVGALRNGTLRAQRGVHAVNGREIIFDDGTVGTYDTVIWATGYVPDYSWLDIPGAKTSQGQLNERQGISTIPGLYFVGLRNQRSIFSSNIYGTHINTPFILSEVKKAMR